MANEATLVLRQEDPIDFIVADGTGIEKGTLLKITSPRTAAAHSGSGDKLAGIAAREKVANSGRTRLAVYRKGIFSMTSGAAISVGDAVMGSATANKVITATGVSGASILGTALSAAAAADQAIEVAVNIGCGGDIA